jgi:hypothetical protein
MMGTVWLRLDNSQESIQPFINAIVGNDFSNLPTSLIRCDSSLALRLCPLWLLPMFQPSWKIVPRSSKSEVTVSTAPSHSWSLTFSLDFHFYVSLPCQIYRNWRNRATKTIDPSSASSISQRKSLLTFFLDSSDFACIFDCSLLAHQLPLLGHCLCGLGDVAFPRPRRG